MSRLRIKSAQTWHSRDNSKLDGNYEKLGKWKPLAYDQLPEWLRDNEYLLNGHRPALPNVRLCFESIFRIHTETGNIWTHMIGCLLFMFIAVYLIWQPLSQDFRLKDKVVVGLFFLAAITCLGLSFTFHTLSCHSPKVSFLFSKLDYAGILILSSFSSTPLIYYCFYCRPDIQLAYVLALGTLFVLTMSFTMMERFSTPQWRPVRTAVFVAFGGLSVLPGYHYGFVQNWSEGIVQTSVGSLTLMSLLYLIGALMYAFRIPERLYPGKFDIVLHSHQFLHIFVIAAALVHFYGISQISTYQLAHANCRRSLS